MDILKYNIIAPKLDKTKPYFYDKRNCLLVPYNYFFTGYKYYLECSSTDECDNIKYIILLSKDKLNENFRQLEIDTYGRYRINLHKDLLEYVKIEVNNNRQNFELDYLETEKENDEEYDVYQLT